MPRRPRVAAAGVPFHVLNRAAGRSRIFRTDADYLAFEKALEQTLARRPIGVLAYCIMPNHFHLVLVPRRDGDLSEFMRLLTVTHTQRWHAHHHTAGTGPLYQGRFKSFPAQADEHLLIMIRYVERNALRANLARRAELWRWCSAWRRLNDPACAWLTPPHDWPAEPPRDWLRLVNTPQTAAEEQAVQTSILRGRPLGSEQWTRRTAARLGLQSTLRPRGRPRVRPIKDSRPV